MEKINKRDSCILWYRVKEFRIMLILLFSMLIIQNSQAQIYGDAPVQHPTGGFAVDGNGYANYSVPGVGDWFSSPLYPGSGGTIFNMGTPEYYDLNYPSISIHFADHWGAGKDPTAFGPPSAKIHYPYDVNFQWWEGNVPDKNDIGNATVLFTRGDESLGGNPDDLWCIFAGDRLSVDGDAYIDFEFLQNPLYMRTTTTNPASGYFEGMGPDGTRTLGDILVTIRFENGGIQANPVVHKWVLISPGPPAVYGWEELPMSDWPANSLYLSSNQEITDAPWDPFGQPEYLINQYAEGAINLSAFVPGIGFDECNYFATVFVRTKTSQSTTAELKDFAGEPYQIDLTPILACSADVDVPACASLDDIRAEYLVWRAGFGFSGGITPTSNLSSLPATFDDVLGMPGVEITDCGGSYTFTLEVDDVCLDEPETCESTFTILGPEDFTMPADDGETIACADDLYTPEPPLVNDYCGNAITPTGPVVSNTPGCEGDVTYVWNYEDCEGNNHDWTYTFTIEYEDFTMPADDGEDVECVTEVTEPTPPTVYDNCGNLITAEGPIVGGTYVSCSGTITYSWTYTDCEGNSHDWVYTYTIDDETAPTITCEPDITQICPDVVIDLPVYSDNCTDVADIILEYSFNGEPYVVVEPGDFPLYENDLLPGVYTVMFRVTDICDNISTEDVIITIIDACLYVDFEANFGNPVFCSMVNNTLTATVGVPYASLSWSVAPGSDWVITSSGYGHSITFDAMADASATFILTITDEDGCSVECDYTVECEPATENCTLTMGGWGQPGGSYCDDLSQHDRLVELLTPVGITIGRTGHSYYSTDGEAGAECIEDLLPAGGPAAGLNAAYTCYNSDNNLKKNVLLGQGLTLAINLRNSEPGLAGLPLNEPFLIADNAYGCSTVPDAYTFSYMTLNVASNVVTYLNNYYGGATVGSLMELVNDALGKVYIPSGSNPKLSDIANAATVINEAFDENCKWAVNMGSPISSPLLPGEPMVDEQDVILTMSPNPFNDQVEIKYILKSDSRVTLEIYNLQGSKVTTLYEGDATASTEYIHRFSPEYKGQQVFLVVLRTVYGTTIERIVHTY